MNRNILLLTIIFWAWTAGCTGAEKAEPVSLGDSPDSLKGPFATVQLVAEPGYSATSDTTWLGLVFELEEGWHLYWNGLNDSGMAPMVSWELPPGATVGNLLWPAPKRKFSPGNILDHVYEGSATLVCPLIINREVDALELKARVEWLVCKEVCLPESARVSLVLELEGTSGAQTDIRISRTLAEQPSSLPETVELQWQENSLQVVAEGADLLRFLPFADCAFPQDLAGNGEALGNTLSIVFEQVSLNKGVHGILEVQKHDVTNRYVLQTRHPGYKAG